MVLYSKSDNSKVTLRMVQLIFFIEVCARDEKRGPATHEENFSSSLAYFGGFNSPLFVMVRCSEDGFPGEQMMDMSRAITLPFLFPPSFP